MVFVLDEFVSRLSSAWLGYVLVGIGVGRVSFHVVTIDETFDPLLQVGRFHREFQLLVEFRDEKIVRQRLPHLHDSNDGSVDLVLAVLDEKKVKIVNKSPH